MGTVVALYGTADLPSFQTIADEFVLNPIKVRKLLIISGAFKSNVAAQVQNMLNKHRHSSLLSIEDIAATMEKLNLSKVPAASYLPYAAE